MRALLNWRNLLIAIAILVVGSTVLYSRYLADKIATEERKYVEAWVEAERTILNGADSTSLSLATKIATDNTEIPIIETNERDEPTGLFMNIDTAGVADINTLLKTKLKQFRRFAPKPIVLVVKETPYAANKYYYGPSTLLTQVQWYPYVQLSIAALFLIIAITTQRIRFKSNQNQLWAGMAKETAHQLGTPVSSLEGWLELLKDIPAADHIAAEMDKDVRRLQLISDRFGKIGSTPQLEPTTLLPQLENMLTYMRKRAGSKVRMELQHHLHADTQLQLSPLLFDWVLENLLKNALDAMDGSGQILIQVAEQPEHFWIDVSDSGKGIEAGAMNKVFQPGFTTKKRGWGLGLTLSKRIIEQYHGGKLSVYRSEPGKGTTFRIVLPK